MGGSKRPRMEDDEINSSCENDPISGTDSVSKEKINLEPLHLPPYDEEATRRYYQQSRESEGLDVDYYPTIKLVGGIAPITEMNDKIKNEVERCSRAAIQNYNEEKVPNLMASSSNPKKQKGRVVEEDEIYCGPKGSYCPSKLTGYSVLIVGFGKIKEKGREKKYCIVRNSWGKEWCDNGYGKVSLELVFDSERKEHVPLLDSMLSPVSVIKM